MNYEFLWSIGEMEGASYNFYYKIFRHQITHAEDLIRGWLEHFDTWWLNQPIWKIWVKLDHFPR